MSKILTPSEADDLVESYDEESQVALLDALMRRMRPETLRDKLRAVDYDGEFEF